MQPTSGYTKSDACARVRSSVVSLQFLKVQTLHMVPPRPQCSLDPPAILWNCGRYFLWFFGWVFPRITLFFVGADVVLTFARFCAIRRICHSIFSFYLCDIAVEVETAFVLKNSIGILRRLLPVGLNDCLFLCDNLQWITSASFILISWALAMASLIEGIRWTNKGIWGDMERICICWLYRIYPPDLLWNYKFY